MIDIDKLLKDNEFKINKTLYHPEDFSEQIIGYLECLYDVGLISKSKWRKLFYEYLEEDIEGIHIHFRKYDEYCSKYIIKGGDVYK